MITINDRTKEKLAEVIVKDITWERIILHMELEVNGYSGTLEELDFYLASDVGISNGKFKVEKIEGNTIFLCMNITNPGYNMCLPNGRYMLVCCAYDDLIAIPQVDLDLLHQLIYKSVTFLHGMRDMGYWVNFSVPEGDDLRLEILAQDMRRKGIDIWNREFYEENPDLMPVKKKAFIDAAKKHAVIRRIYNTKLNEAKKKQDEKEKKTILFMSEQSEELGENLKSVIRRLEERGLADRFEILTSARNMVGKGSYGIKSWVGLMTKLAKADQIFVDDHCPFMDWLRLDPELEIIQLWHAGAGYKSSGYSRWGHLGAPTAFSCHRQYDYGITASKNIAHFFSEVFGINTERILPTGMPRMDEYLDPSHREVVEERLRKEYPFINGKKVILFAPTYRGLNRASAHYPYELIDFDALYELCGDEYVVMFKMHPWVNMPVPIKEDHKDKFVDMNNYPIINDLFYVTDLFITDYSSGVFEFSLMRKPMMFFAFDEHQYSFTRGFHRDYRPAAPGKVCHTFDEILKAIKDEDFEFYKNEDYINYHFDHVDSNASDRVIDWFILGNIPEDISETLAEIDRENERLKSLDFTNCQLFDDSVIV